MSFILTPAAPVAPEGPSFTPANDTQYQPPERGSTFGPTLSDARQRLAGPEDRRHEPAERRSPRSERPERSDRSERPDRLERPERPDQRPRAERTVPSDRSSDRNDASRAEAAQDADAADRPENESAEDEASTSEATAAEATPAADVAVSDAPTSAEAAMAATLLATANGAAGEGDPLIDLTVEEVAAPELAAEAGDVDTTVIVDGVTDVDIEAMTGSTTDSVDPEVAEMGRRAALTSLGQVTDANLGLAERIRPATAEEVAGPAISVDDSTRADPFAQVTGEESVIDAPIQGRIDETSTERAGVADTQTAAEEAPDVAAVDAPAVQADAVEVPAQRTAINTVAQADSPDAVVVLAREATAPTEGAKAAPAASTQTTAPLPTAAEANLWEDVRSAFDRIRSTGDGQEVRIRLRPAELGELLVQVRTQGDNVSVRLVTSSAAAQQTLVDDRLRLAAELARAGFDEGSVDIGQSNAGDANQRGDQSGDGSDADRGGQSFGAVTGLDRVGTVRDVFERRDPIRTESGFRPGRTAQSTINLTL